MINLKNISLERDKFTLGPINREIKRGERIALMGDNGSGKTTLLDIISGLEESYKGELLSDEKISYAISESEESLFNATVLDEFRYTLRGMKKADVKERAARLLKSLSLDPSYLEKSPFSLSGGEKRLLSIALAIAKEPSFVLFDESLSGLDYKGYMAFRSLLKGSNFGFIITTHDTSILDLVDSLILLDKGSVIFDGRVEDAMRCGLIEKSFSYKKSIELFGEVVLSLDELIRRVKNE